MCPAFFCIIKWLIDWLNRLSKKTLVKVDLTGKLSRVALNRCTAKDLHWNEKAVSQGSSLAMVRRRPNSRSKLDVLVLKGIYYYYDTNNYNYNYNYYYYYYFGFLSIHQITWTAEFWNFYSSSPRQGPGNHRGIFARCVLCFAVLPFEVCLVIYCQVPRFQMFLEVFWNSSQGSDHHWNYCCFLSQSRSISILRSWYFAIFPTSFCWILLSPGIATSMSHTCFFSTTDIWYVVHQMFISLNLEIP